MKNQGNYDHGFAEVYADWVSSVAAVTDVNRKFYVERFMECSGPAVELGVGDGRIAVEAARQGQRMIGIDNSQAMLDLCSARAREERATENIQLQLADFRDFDLEHPVELIAIPFHSIGHMLSEADKLACMAHIKANLVPGGRFLFDHFVPDLDYARTHTGLPVLRSHRVDPETGAGRLLWAANTFDLETGVISIRAISEEHGADGKLSNRRVSSTFLSTIQPADSRRLLEQSGFEIEACYGDFEGTPFDQDSGAQVWVARKPKS